MKVLQKKFVWLGIGAALCIAIMVGFLSTNIINSRQVFAEQDNNLKITDQAGTKISEAKYNPNGEVVIGVWDQNRSNNNGSELKVKNGKQNNNLGNELLLILPNGISYNESASELLNSKIKKIVKIDKSKNGQEQLKINNNNGELSSGLPLVLNSKIKEPAKIQLIAMKDNRNYGSNIVTIPKFEDNSNKSVTNYKNSTNDTKTATNVISPTNSLSDTIKAGTNDIFPDNRIVNFPEYKPTDVVVNDFGGSSTPTVIDAKFAFQPTTFNKESTDNDPVTQYTLVKYFVHGTKRYENVKKLEGWKLSKNDAGPDTYAEFSLVGFYNSRPVKMRVYINSVPDGHTYNFGVGTSRLTSGNPDGKHFLGIESADRSSRFRGKWLPLDMTYKFYYGDTGEEFNLPGYMTFNDLDHYEGISIAKESGLVNAFHTNRNANNSLVNNGDEFTSYLRPGPLTGDVGSTANVQDKDHWLMFTLNGTNGWHFEGNTTGTSAIDTTHQTLGTFRLPTKPIKIGDNAESNVKDDKIEWAINDYVPPIPELSFAPKKFQISDQIDSVLKIDNFTIIDDQGNDVSRDFDVSNKNNLITATAKTGTRNVGLLNDNFYGKTYTLKINTSLDKSADYSKYVDSDGNIVIPNKGVASALNTYDSVETKLETNIAYGKIVPPPNPTPKPSIDKKVTNTSGNNESVKIGDLLKYTIKIDNANPNGPLKDASIKDIFPESLDAPEKVIVDNETITNWSFDNSTRTLKIPLKDVTRASTIEVYAKVNDKGVNTTIINTAHLLGKGQNSQSFDINSSVSINGPRTLVFVSAPKLIDYGSISISNAKQEHSYQSIDQPLSVWDNRLGNDNYWTMTAKLDNFLTDDLNDKLQDNIIYKENGDKKILSPNMSITVLKHHTINNDVVNISDDWNHETSGLFIETNGNERAKDFNGTITWTLASSPRNE